MLKDLGAASDLLGIRISRNRKNRAKILDLKSDTVALPFNQQPPAKRDTSVKITDSRSILAL